MKPDQQLIHHRIHLGLGASPFAHVEATLAIEVVRSRGDKAAMLGDAYLGMREVGFEIPGAQCCVVDNVFAGCRYVLVVNFRCDAVPLEPVLHDHHEVIDDHCRVCMDADVLHGDVAVDGFHFHAGAGSQCQHGKSRKCILHVVPLLTASPIADRPSIAAGHPGVEVTRGCCVSSPSLLET